MRTLLTILIALATAPAAHAQGLFARGDPTSGAAIGLNFLGLAILSLAAAPAVGALVAAVWISLHREHRPHASWR
jgi:hypothetical protein